MGKWLTAAFFISALMLSSVGLMWARQGVPPEALADPDGQFIDIDGARIYYIERGPVDGQAVILMHGFGGSTFSWRHNIDVLAESGYRVITYDRPPFGLSDKEPLLDRSTSAQAAQAAALLDSLGIRTAVFVGHSAGGGVIAHLAIRHPQRIDGLVFVAGALNGELRAQTSQQQTESPFTGLFRFVADLDPESPLSQALIRTFLTPERFATILTSAYYDPEIVTDEIIAGYSRVLRVEGWEAAFLSVLQIPESADQALRLSALVQVGAEFPVLIIWGEEDTWIRFELGERLHSLIPGAQWILYPFVGHLPMEENVAQFNDDLLSFLNQVEQEACNQ
jgi:pimeloyl-ACP methyl ester carboxylesterase